MPEGFRLLPGFAGGVARDGAATVGAAKLATRKVGLLNGNKIEGAIGGTNARYEIK